MEILTNSNAPVRRLVIGLLLPALMLVLVVGGLSGVGDAEPELQVSAAGAGAERATPSAADLAERMALSRADRSTRIPVSETTVPLTALTTAPPATVAPTTAPPTTAAVAPPTTARPTTTTSKPTPTTAKPTTTTTSPPTTAAPASGNQAEGDASWYDHRNGICAHRTLPFGTVVRVTNLGNGKATTCTVGDRGPFVQGRIIDLDRAQFSEIASPSSGVIRVRIEW